MKRSCGACQLCCRLLPVKSLNKGGGERCQHQRYAKGCAVYRQLGMVSPECRLWSCRWLVDPDAAELHRPDHCDYVVDVVPDMVKAVKDTGEEFYVPVLQVWLDHPRAHHDPALRAYMVRLNMPAIIRLNERAAFLLIPPSMSGTGEWMERQTDIRGTESLAILKEAVESGQFRVSVGISG